MGSAISYIPEVVWNDDSTNGSLASGGGGSSTYFVKPSWQTGTGVTDAARTVPDVAMPASADHDAYLICTTGYCASNNGYYSASSTLSVIGGTSVGAPVMAGILALVEQKTGSKPLGVANPKIYALANSTYKGNVFHDTVSGTNASPCTTGTTDCPSGVAIGYTALTGYDRASGWGSVDAGNLANDWGLVTAVATTPAGTNPTIVNLSGSSSTVLQGTTVTLTATVASSQSSVTATPTGTVQFVVDGAVSGTPVALSAASATFSLATTGLATGTHKVQAAYSGDATYLGSSATFTITVGTTTSPDFTLSPATAAVSATSGSSAPVLTFTVAPVNGFTGTVNFSLSSANTSAAVTPVLSATSATISGTGTATTTLTLLAFKPSVTKGSITASAMGPAPWMRLGGGVFFAGMMLLLMPKRRKLARLLVLIAGAAVISMTGCGNGTGGTTPTSPSQTNAAAGTYSYTLFATGTSNGVSVSHSSVITFTVN